MLPWEDLDSELKKNVGLQFSVITAGMDTGKKTKKLILVSSEPLVVYVYLFVCLLRPRP